jgi:hypothetical protein
VVEPVAGLLQEVGPRARAAVTLALRAFEWSAFPRRFSRLPPARLAERLARDEARRDPARRDEWSYLILHLRRFASADGVLPTEFDPLVRESFGGLLERSQGT